MTKKTPVFPQRATTRCAPRGADYIQFVDSDDYLAPNATEQLVRTAESLRCDLVIADYFRVAPLWHHTALAF